MEDTLRKSLAVSAMFMWIILAALAFGAVFDGLGAVKAIEVCSSRSGASSPGRCWC